MKALVDIASNLVVGVHETGYEVHPDCKWVDCPDNCRAYWIYDANTNTVFAPAPITLSYKDKREFEYPPLQAQLDMQYWDSVNGTTVWADTIAAIKTKYPKPTE